MAPPRKYSTSELARALTVAPSVIGACRLAGIAQGALRKRAKTDPGLKRVYAACLARCHAQSGRHLSDRAVRQALTEARDSGLVGRKA